MNLPIKGFPPNCALDCRFEAMQVFVANHPLITHKLTLLRDKNTPSTVFRQLVEELVTLLAYEATKDIPIQKIKIETPVSATIGVQLSTPGPLIVPILRAGLGMLEGMQKLLPTAEVGFLGIQRNEQTLQPHTYAERLPEHLDNREVFILDPMLATGGTLIDSVNYVFERGAKRVIAICLIGAPEGLAALEQATVNNDVMVVLGALDEKLNEKGYIVPGLGDAGDRLYGTAD